DGVGQYRQADIRKTGRIAVGAKAERGDLRPDPFNHMAQNWLAGQFQQAFVAAAHAARQSTSQDDACNVLHHGFQLSYMPSGPMLGPALLAAVSYRPTVRSR